MEEKIAGFILIAIIVVVGMWLLEVGPFEKNYPSEDYYGGSYDNSYNGGANISFTGHNGPCDYGDHNCPFRCNDWRVPNGGGPKCGYCGHDTKYHDINNRRY